MERRPSPYLMDVPRLPSLFQSSIEMIELHDNFMGPCIIPSPERKCTGDDCIKTASKLHPNGNIWKEKQKEKEGIGWEWKSKKEGQKKEKREKIELFFHFKWPSSTFLNLPVQSSLIRLKVRPAIQPWHYDRQTDTEKLRITEVRLQTTGYRLPCLVPLDHNAIQKVQTAKRKTENGKSQRAFQNAAYRSSGT